MLIPSWAKFKEPLRVSEASLRRIKREEAEKALQSLADERHARGQSLSDLIIKPQ